MIKPFAMSLLRDKMFYLLRLPNADETFLYLNVLLTEPTHETFLFLWVSLVTHLARCKSDVLKLVLVKPTNCSHVNLQNSKFNVSKKILFSLQNPTNNLVFSDDHYTTSEQTWTLPRGSNARVKLFWVRVKLFWVRVKLFWARAKLF